MHIDEPPPSRLGGRLLPTESAAVVVIGCGNLLRGDDGVGPSVVRRLAAGGVPDHVTLVDGGIAGMTVASTMRGARKLVLIDAVSTGEEPGTVFRVTGADLERRRLPELTVTHDLRWQHALALGRLMLGEDYPDDVVVFLIEIAHTRAGMTMSDAVEASLDRVGSLVRAEWGEPR